MIFFNNVFNIIFSFEVTLDILLLFKWLFHLHTFLIVYNFLAFLFLPQVGSFTLHNYFFRFRESTPVRSDFFSTLRTGDADLRFYIMAVQDG
jgi:hypothetical protein